MKDKIIKAYQSLPQVSITSKKKNYYLNSVCDLIKKNADKSSGYKDQTILIKLIKTKTKEKRPTTKYSSIFVQNVIKDLFSPSPIG